MWCVPKLDEEYVTRMEDVLETLAKPLNEREPVVALDERPVQLLDSARPGIPMVPGRIARSDYEYVRHGTANIFCIVEPKGGGHLTHATRNRKAPRFADAVKKIAAAHPTAKTIHLVMANLNTHCQKSLTDAFGASRCTAPPSTRAGSTPPRSRSGSGLGNVSAGTGSPPSGS